MPLKHILGVDHVVVTVRDLDAAARAWLDSQDALPLLRLVAEVNTGSVDAPADYSYGLAEAVTCTQARW